MAGDDDDDSSTVSIATKRRLVKYPWLPILTTTTGEKEVTAWKQKIIAKKNNGNKTTMTPPLSCFILRIDK
jgi:hypothetical protein